MNLQLFIRALWAGVIYFAYFFIIFFLSRIVFFIFYSNGIFWEESIADIFSSFIIGGRFDISVICYGFLPIIVFCLISLFIKNTFAQIFQKIYLTFCKYYLLFILIIFLSLQIIDFFFYQFFQSRINALFFGIFNDDTKAILNSVWKDYPIVKIIIVFIFVKLGFLYTHRIVCNNWYKRNTLICPAHWGLLFIFPLFIIGMRGSIGVFTLRREHTNISTNIFINSLCYNAIYALKFAMSELKEVSIEPNLYKELENKGFNSIDEVKNYYKQQSSTSFDDNLYAKTSVNDFLAKNPPNVVFILMESMSNHYFELHSSELNLLGDMEGILPDLYYFKNGLPSFNGTIFSLENLLVNSPKSIISQSPYSSILFSASVAMPFKKQGYNTSFITGGHLSWRNIDTLIKNQGFDKIEGSAHLKKQNPKAESFAWGIHDGYLFDYIIENLKKYDQPQFIFSLTVSNHTPYEIPKHYTPYPINIKNVKNKIRVEEEIAYDNFYLHQYSVSQLANFIKKIRNSSLGENNIIVATGDHNIRQIFEYNDTDAFMKYSVPILFYIPEKYKPSFFDENIMVSHKDIFPTIFNLSLSDQKYIYSGDNMFKKLEYRFGVNGYRFMADSVGVLSTENIQPMYYLWKDKSKRKLKIGDVSSPHAQSMLSKLKVYETILTLNTYMDIEKSKNKK